MTLGAAAGFPGGPAARSWGLSGAATVLGAGHFGSEPAQRRVLPASLRRLVVDLKAEHPAPNLN